MSFVLTETKTEKDGSETVRHAGGTKSGLLGKLDKAGLPNWIRYELSKKGFVELPTETGGKVRYELKEKGVSDHGKETNEEKEKV